MRKAKVAADFFVRQPVADQHGFINALNGRVTFPADDAPAVALLDTGVNHGHPLLNQVITEQDLYTHNPAWGVHDTGAHGTGMAGLALYGDLTPIFAGDAPVILRHRLQSHKLINDADRHDPKLYGAVTAEGVARLEVDPAPSRVYCMAITTDGKDRGRPTSWSAAVDNIAFGTDSDRRRLVVLSAGNCSAPANYPNDNFTSSVQDPAQSWNALTVGGTTDKVFVNQEQNPGWQALAPEGDLSPSSTTSMNWPRSPRWPFKPDIVMEAGNMGSGPNNGRMHLDEMLLLTTNDEFAVGQSPLMTFRQTSAATALAARLAASLWAQYPTFTPETIRALLVHSARWTPAMLARYTNGEGVLHTINLLRTYGHGVPNEAALYTSANNALSRSPEVERQCAELTRDAENTLREDEGIPRVGEGWVAETKLYYDLKTAFPSLEVVHHARTEWLGYQHLDIFFPSLLIAFEYQGAQHDAPVDYFGGEEAFKRQRQRDARKRSLCLKHNVQLIEVREGYLLEDLLTSVRRHF